MTKTSMIRRISITAKRVCVAAQLAVVMSACGEGGRLTPTSPGNTTVTTATYTVSGVVSEMTLTGRAPVAGVVVQPTPQGMAATTDASGAYTISGVPAGADVVLTATREGYHAAVSVVTVRGHMRLDIDLRRYAPYTLSGIVYEMTETGKVPIEGADVHDSMTHRSSQTGRDGSYILGEMSGGYVYLDVSKPGYKECVREFTMVASERMDIELVRR